MDMLAIQGMITTTLAVMYALYLFFQGLSFRGNARALTIISGKKPCYGMELGITIL